MSTQYGQPLNYGTNKTAYLQFLLTNEGTIEFTARFARYLADLRTGSTSPHTNDLTLVDMAQIWGAWRNGISGETCFANACGFANLAEFQTKSNLGPQAQLGYSIFEYFRDFFNR